MPTLVAMADSGELYITRQGGRWWLHRPFADRPTSIDEARAGVIIARADLTPVGEELPSWPALDTRRLELVTERRPAPEVDVSAWNADDVRSMIRVAGRWRDRGEGSKAQDLLIDLLAIPCVVSDGDLHTEVRDALRSMAATRPTIEFTSSSPEVRDRTERAIRRLEDLAAA